MKNLFKLSLFALMSVALFVACSKDDNEYQEPQLDVTPNNIAGCWMLESYDNGQTLADGSYVYIDFVRADRSYTLYQNVDSALSRAITGSYYIDTDAEYGAIIRGQYDFGVGDWSHRYIVSSLTASKMVWVAKDDASDVSVYVRATLPDGIE